MSERAYKTVDVGPKTVQIPVEWKIEKLGDSKFSEWITQGPNPDYSKGTPSKEYRVLKTKDVYDDKIHYDGSDMISEEIFNNRKKYRLKEGDILIAIVGKGSIGKTNIFREQCNKEYIFTRAIGLVRPNKQNLLPEYLHHYFQSHDAKQYFDKSITGSTGQEVLRTTALKTMDIPVPPLEEQKKITEILSTLDQSIDQLYELINYKKELREGLMQDLLNGKVRSENIDLN